MGFDIMDLQRGRGEVQARSRADGGRAVLKYIDVEDLVPSEDNFYSMSAIEELAGLIELSGGVKQPALVSPLGGGKYRVISGHRRRLASLRLVKEGKEVYRKMPCLVEEPQAVDAKDAAEAAELREVDEAILLITTNGQREKTDWDKVQEATRLRALLDQKRRFEKVPGETRKIIAEWLGTTPAQVGRYDSIEKHLIQELRDWLQRGWIGISVAYELSTLPADVQENVAAEFRGKGASFLSLEDVRRWKEHAAQKACEPEHPPRNAEQSAVEAEQSGIKPEQSVREMEQSAGPERCVPESEETPPAPGQEAEPSVGQGDGKIVDFPLRTSPTPVPPEEAVREPEADIEWAVLMLKALRNYCGTMADVKGGQTVPWAEYAEAVDIAIAALWKGGAG